MSKRLKSSGGHSGSLKQIGKNFSRNTPSQYMWRKQKL